MRARGVPFVVLLLFSAAWLEAPTRADVPALRAYEGRWAYADGRDGVRGIEQAVARSVEGLPFFAEPIAANAMRRIARPFSRVTFASDGNRLEFSADAWGPVGSAIGGHGERIPSPDGGSQLLLRQYLDEGRLVQVFEHADGRRENRFALSGDQQWLWMTVRITSPQLPGECRYRLRYRRMDPPPSQIAER